MTEDENAEKHLRKESIKKELSEIQRKIALCTKMLGKAKKCQELLKTEYQELDRELYEEYPGIKIIKTRKKDSKTRKKDSKTNEAKILNGYKNMSPEDQKVALSRLLKIQANMTQKT